MVFQCHSTLEALGDSRPNGASTRSVWEKPASPSPVPVPSVGDDLVERAPVLRPVTNPLLSQQAHTVGVEALSGAKGVYREGLVEISSDADYKLA